MPKIAPRLKPNPRDKHGRTLRAYARRSCANRGFRPQDGSVHKFGQEIVRQTIPGLGVQVSPTAPIVREYLKEMPQTERRRMYLILKATGEEGGRALAIKRVKNVLKRYGVKIRPVSILAKGETSQLADNRRWVSTWFYGEEPVRAMRESPYIERVRERK